MEYTVRLLEKIGIKSPGLNSRLMNDQYSASGFTAIQFAPKIQKFCVGSDLGTASSVHKYNTPLVSNLAI